MHTVMHKDSVIYQPVYQFLNVGELDAETNCRFVTR